MKNIELKFGKIVHQRIIEIQKIDIKHVEICG